MVSSTSKLDVVFLFWNITVLISELLKPARSSQQDCMEIIDNVALDFGMLMGSMELAGTVGLDICKSAAISLGAAIPQTRE